MLSRIGRVFDQAIVRPLPTPLSPRALAEPVPLKHHALFSCLSPPNSRHATSMQSFKISHPRLGVYATWKSSTIGPATSSLRQCSSAAAASDCHRPSSINSPSYGIASLISALHHV